MCEKEEKEIDFGDCFFLPAIKKKETILVRSHGDESCQPAEYAASSADNVPAASDGLSSLSARFVFLFFFENNRIFKH